MDELNGRALSGMQLASVCAGALWAALNGTWAMIYGLNTAYEVKEGRSWRQMTATIAGLTLSLAITGSIAVFLIFGQHPRGHFHSLEWMVLSAALALSFALLYRFAPNVRRHAWCWTLPGALCALSLWIGSTLARSD